MLHVVLVGYALCDSSAVLWAVSLTNAEPAGAGGGVVLAGLRLLAARGRRQQAALLEELLLRTGRDQVECSMEEFIDRWAQHIPELFQHAGFWTVCQARARPNLGSYLCHSETGAKATPQA